MSESDGLSLEAKIQIEERKVAGLEAQLGAMAAQVEEQKSQREQLAAAHDKVALEAATLREDNRRLKADADVSGSKIASLEAELGQARKKVAEAENASLAASVTEIAQKAIKAGAAPAFFDGHDDDPAAWLKSNFVSLEAFQRFADALPRRAASAPVSSGQPTDDTVALSGDRAKHLREMGLDPALALINNANELQSRKK